MSSTAAKLSAFATGASFTGLTAIDTVAGALDRVPSEAMKRKLAGPLKSSVGAKVNAPVFASNAVTLPPKAEPVTSANVKPGPSTSVAVTEPVTDVSSAVTIASGDDTGASFTGATAIDTVAGAPSSEPSKARKAKASAPFASGFGLYRNGPATA